MFKIFIKETNTYNLIKIKEIIDNSIKFLGKPFENKKIYLIKPNLLKPANPESAITTHPIVIKAVVELIKDNGGITIIGDSPGLSSAEKVLKKLDLLDFLKYTNTEIADFSKKRNIKNEKNLLYKEISLPEIIFQVDEIINIPKLKTHQMMVLTLAVKNLYGLIYGIEKIKYHFLADKDYTKFAKLLLDIYKNVNPQINILDGITGMEGNGPSSGVVKNFGILGFSNNALSLDYTIAKIFNLDPYKIPHLNSAIKENFLEIREQFLQINSDIRFNSKHITLHKAHSLSFSMPDFVSKLVKSFVIPYPAIDRKLCKLCKICLNTCPVKAIYQKDFILIDKKKCIRCYCCQELCDKNAINIKRSILNVWK